MIPTELARIWTARPDWMLDAACRGMSPDLFFPQRGENQHPALKVCADCPVKAQCGEAGRNEYYGLWGGRGARARRGDRIVDWPAPHGTLSLYRAGCGCSECGAANNRREQQRKAARRAS